MDKLAPEITPIPEIDWPDQAHSEGEMLEYLQGLEDQRNLTRRAAADAMKNLFQDEAVGQEENLMEIGAGTGYFASLVSKKIRHRLLQTESDPVVLAEAQKRFSAGRYQKLDASHMPEIRDESVDRMFAMNLLNVRPPDVIRSIMSEVRRVLRPGGTFYSILDLRPNKNSVDWHMAKRQGINYDEEWFVATTHARDGFVYCGVGDNEAEVARSAFGCGPPQYETGSYFAQEVCAEWFEEFFPHADTNASIVTGQYFPLYPFAMIRPLLLSNPNIDVRKRIDEEVIPAWRKRFSVFSLPLSWPEHCFRPREIEKKRFGKLRTVEIYGAYVNKGVKAR